MIYLNDAGLLSEASSSTFIYTVFTVGKFGDFLAKQSFTSVSALGELSKKVLCFSKYLTKIKLLNDLEKIPTEQFLINVRKSP